MDVEAGPSYTHEPRLSAAERRVFDRGAEESRNSYAWRTAGARHPEESRLTASGSAGA